MYLCHDTGSQMGPGLMWAHKLSYHGLQYFHGGQKIHNQLGKKVHQDADVYQRTMAQPENTVAVIHSDSFNLPFR